MIRSLYDLANVEKQIPRNEQHSLGTRSIFQLPNLKKKKKKTLHINIFSSVQIYILKYLVY